MASPPAKPNADRPTLWSVLAGLIITPLALLAAILMIAMPDDPPGFSGGRHALYEWLLDIFWSRIGGVVLIVVVLWWWVMRLWRK